MGNAEDMALQHYKYFLKETAASLGMSDEELQKITNFQTPEQVQTFINALVAKYGISQKELMLLPVPQSKSTLPLGEEYNEWETE